MICTCVGVPICELNMLGLEGWEVVSVTIDKAGHYNYLMKRELKK
jgi:hypothetical protein